MDDRNDTNPFQSPKSVDRPAPAAPASPSLAVWAESRVVLAYLLWVLVVWMTFLGVPFEAKFPRPTFLAFWSMVALAGATSFAAYVSAVNSRRFNLVLATLPLVAIACTLVVVALASITGADH